MTSKSLESTAGADFCRSRKRTLQFCKVSFFSRFLCYNGYEAYGAAFAAPYADGQRGTGGRDMKAGEGVKSRSGDLRAGGAGKLCRAWLPTALAVALIVFVLLLLHGRRQAVLNELAPQNGVLDASAVDFSEQVFAVRNDWDFYPGRLYASEDFAAGVDEKPLLAGRDISSSEVPFGTYRLILKAKPNQSLALCGFSLDYGTRVLVNGEEVLTFGRVADSAEEAVPAGGYMTVPIFVGESGEAEIIYQYSNFVHTEGGSIPFTFLSSPQRIEEYKAGNVLVSVGLSGAMLILALYFLLAASVQRQRSYLALAFCCLLMALRDNLFWGTYLLPPGASWQLTYRTSLTVASLLPFAFLLLLRSLYPAGRRRVHFVYIGLIAADVLLLLLLDTKKSVLFCRAAYYVSVPYLIYLLCSLLHGFLREKRKIRTADVLALAGLAFFLAALLSEALLSGRSSFVTRFGLTPVGMLLCLLLIAVSVSLRVHEQKAALAQSRSRGELLERMNALNLDFFHKIAHELKTPLTVISGYAQLAGLQLAGNELSGETRENLKTVQQEAMRLADLVTKLMEYSYGRQSEVSFGAVEVGALLDSVQAVCAPMCLKNGNRVEVAGRDCADVYGNKKMLLQIFINLVSNANRHTKNGVVTVSASDGEDGRYAVFRVGDTGGGLSEEAKLHLFEKGWSADGGSGLGLAICAEAVEAHGGSIRVESTGPEGTVFAFTAPKTEGTE